ncbi:hypothetical protein QLX67_07895 [Balneolaceae bacterium ANBcel3]|nr:hypothetical protein [Balneolaceae bacterium ANBcel3]
MKSRILTLAVLFVAFAVGTTQAQQTSDVSVSANVLTTFDFTEFGGDDGVVDFDEVIPGSSPNLEPQDLGSSIDVGPAATLALLQMTGPNIEITIAHDENLTLNSSLGPSASDLLYTPVIFGAQDETDQSSSTQIVQGGYTVTLQDNNYFLWVGGTLEAPGGGEIPATAGGSYSGEFNITVDIN